MMDNTVQKLAKWNAILQKSDAGRTMISHRQIQLTRIQRNMLVIANGKFTAEELVTMLGTTYETVDSLLEMGLLEIAGWFEPKVQQPSEEVHADIVKSIIPELNIELPELDGSSSFHRTYAFLSIQIPEFFGLMSFTQILKLERASNLAELSPLIDKLLEKVAKKRGADAVVAYREKLALLAKE